MSPYESYEIIITRVRNGVVVKMYDPTHNQLTHFNHVYVFNNLTDFHDFLTEWWHEKEIKDAHSL